MDKIILNVRYANSNQFQKIDPSAANAGSAIVDTKNVMEDVVSSLAGAVLMFAVADLAAINKTKSTNSISFQSLFLMTQKNPSEKN
jgi:phosphoribosyl-AMP cyclohydrolase